MALLVWRAQQGGQYEFLAFAVIASAAPLPTAGHWIMQHCIEIENLSGPVTFQMRSLYLKKYYNCRVFQTGCAKVGVSFSKQRILHF